jgi:hypothetical protein
MTQVCLASISVLYLRKKHIIFTSFIKPEQSLFSKREELRVNSTRHVKTSLKLETNNKLLIT